MEAVNNNSSMQATTVDDSTSKNIGVFAKFKNWAVSLAKEVQKFLGESWSSVKNNCKKIYNFFATKVGLEVLPITKPVNAKGQDGGQSPESPKVSEEPKQKLNSSAEGESKGQKPPAKNNHVVDKPTAGGGSKGQKPPAKKNHVVDKPTAGGGSKGHKPPAMGNQDGALPSAKNNPVGNQPPAKNNPVGNQPPAMGNQEGALPSAKNNPVGNQPPAMGNQEGALPSAKNNPVGNQPPAMGNQEGALPSAKNNPVGNQPPAMGNQEGTLPSAKNNPVGNQPPAMGNQEGTLPSAKNNPVGNQPPAMGNQEGALPSAKNNPVGNQPPAMGNQEVDQPSAKNNPVGNQPPAMGNQEGALPSAKNNPVGNQPPTMGNQEVDQPSAKNNPVGNQPPAMGNQEGALPSAKNNPVGNQPPTMGNQEVDQPTAKNNPVGNQPPAMGNQEGALPSAKNNPVGNQPPAMGNQEVDQPSAKNNPVGNQPPAMGNQEGVLPPVMGQPNGSNPASNKSFENEQSLSGSQSVPQDQSQNINLSDFVFLDDNGQLQLTTEFVNSLRTTLDNTPQDNKRAVMLKELQKIYMPLEGCTIVTNNPVGPVQKETRKFGITEFFQMVYLNEGLKEHWVHVCDPEEILENYKNGLCEEIRQGTTETPDIIEIENMAKDTLTNQGVKDLDGNSLAHLPEYVGKLRDHIKQAIDIIASGQNGVQDGSKANPSGLTPPVIDETNGVPPSLKENSEEENKGINPETNERPDNKKPLNGGQRVPQDQSQSINLNNVVFFDENKKLQLTTEFVNSLKTTLDKTPENNKSDVMLEQLNEIYTALNNCMNVTANPVGPAQQEPIKIEFNEFFQMICLNEDLKEHWVHAFDPEWLLENYKNGLCEEIRQGTTEAPDMNEIEAMTKNILTRMGTTDLDGKLLANSPAYLSKFTDHIKHAIDIIASDSQQSGLGQNGVQDDTKANPSGLTPPVIDETNGVPPSLKENSEEENKGINPETNERPDNKEPLNGGQRVPQDQSQNINLNNVVFFDDNQFQLTQQFVKSLITKLDNTPQDDKNFVMLEKIAEISFALSTCQTASDANPVEPDQQELTDIYFNERSMQMICLHENLTEHWVHIFDPLNILETHKSDLSNQIIEGTNDPINIEEIATKALSREGIKGLDGKLLANSPAYLEKLKKHIAQGVNRMARTPVQSTPDQNGIQDGSKKNPSGPAQQVINGTEGDNPPLQQNSKEDTPVKGVNNLPKIDDQTAKRNDFKEKIIANVSFTENGVMSTYEGLTTDLKKSIEGLSNTEKFNTLWKINNRVQSKYPTKPKAASGTEEVEPKQRKVKRDYSNSFVRYIFNNDDLKDEWVYLFDAEECFTEYMGTLTDEMRNNFNNDKSHITETHYKNCAKHVLRKNQIKDSKGKSFATNEQHYDKLKNYLIMSLTTNNE